MLYLYKFIYKTFLLPPGIFIVLLLVFTIRLYRHHKIAARILALITVCLYAFSIPLVGDLLIRSLEGRYSPPPFIQGDVIVVLGGGATPDTPDIDGLGHLSGSAANRILTAARLHKKTGLPVIFTGGQVYRNSGNEASVAKRVLNDLGVPEDKIILEKNSRNTAENALYTARILKSREYKHPILVTSAFHMQRSVQNFSKSGVEVVPYPTGYLANATFKMDYNLLIPESTEKTRIALKEYLGIMAGYLL